MIDNKKVFFVQEMNIGEYETESIWCQFDGENFIIDNIPFIAKRISLGDTIKAELDEEDNQYYFDDFVAKSGNTTVRIYFHNNDYIEEVRNWLNKKDCESEVLPSRSVLAVNIPKSINYSPIKNYLEIGEQKNKWTYEESCLEHEY